MSYSVADSTLTGVTNSTYDTGSTYTGATVNTEALRNLESGKSCCCDCLWACMLNDNDDSDKDTVEHRKPRKKKSSRKPIIDPLRETRGRQVTKIEEDEPWSFMDSPTSDDDGKSIIHRLQSQQEKEEYLEYRQWKKQKEMKLMKLNSRASLSKNRRTSSASRSKSRPRYDDDSTIETRESDRTECSESLDSEHPRHDSGKSERSTRSKRKSWLGRKAKSDRNRETRGPSRSRSRSEIEGHEHHRSRSRGKKESSDLPPRSAKDSVKKSKKAKRTGILLKKSKGYKDSRLDEAHPSAESPAMEDPGRIRTSTEGGIQPRQGEKPKGKGILVNGPKSRELESSHKKSSKSVSGSNKTNDQLSHSDPSQETSLSDEAQTTGKPFTRDRDADTSVPSGIIDHDKVDNMDDKGAMHDRAVDTTSSGELDDNSSSEAKATQTCIDTEKANEEPKTPDHAPADSTSTRDEINPGRAEKSVVADDDREEAEHTPTSTLNSVLKPLESPKHNASGHPKAQPSRSREPYFPEKVGGIFHSLPSEAQSVKSSHSFSTTFSMGAIFHSLSSDRNTVPTNVMVDKDDPSAHRLPQRTVLSTEQAEDILPLVVSETASTYMRRKHPMVPASRNLAPSRDAGSVVTLDPLPISPRELPQFDAGPSSVC